MAKLVFRLRNVPDDEAHAVRTLLDDNHIEWYETTAGNWGIAMPGLWVNNANDAEKSRLLIDQYQIERRENLRNLYEQGLITGETKTFMQSLFDKPLLTIAIVVFCIFIVYVSINPFMQLIKLSAQ